MKFNLIRLLFVAVLSLCVVMFFSVSTPKVSFARGNSGDDDNTTWASGGDDGGSDDKSSDDGSSDDDSSGGKKKKPKKHWRTDGNANIDPDQHFLGTTDEADLVIKTNNDEKMRVTTEGDVGIGTDSPDGKLDVRTPGGSVLITSSTTNAPDIRLDSNNNEDGGQIEWRTNSTRHFNIDQNYDTLRFFTEDSVDDGNGEVKMVITESGNVGIGTTSPEGKLVIQLPKWTDRDENSQHVIFGDGNSGLRFGFDGSGMIGSINVLNPNHFWGTLVLQDDAGGKVGIGTTNPVRKLSVNGDAGGTTGWFTDSDIRLKKDIITIEKALDKVEKLRGVQFEWKDITNHPEGKQIGFIAQEAKAILPEVVSKKGENLSMQYAPITALLVEAVKELKAENDSVKDENKMLKDKLTALSDRQSAIEDMLLALSTDLPKEKLAMMNKIDEK